MLYALMRIVHGSWFGATMRGSGFKV